MANEFGLGIVIERNHLISLPSVGFEDALQPHREDGHSFFLLESGTVSLEIDFKKHDLPSPSVIYMHPDQVHRILTFENVTVSSWSIDRENLHPAYLTLLESITPATPLPLDKETFSLISDAVALSLKFFSREKDQLYHSLLRDSCNALVALVVSLYLKPTIPPDKPTRAEVIQSAAGPPLHDGQAPCRLCRQTKYICPLPERMCQKHHRLPCFPSYTATRDFRS